MIVNGKHRLSHISSYNFPIKSQCLLKSSRITNLEDYSSINRIIKEYMWITFRESIQILNFFLQKNLYSLKMGWTFEVYDFILFEMM